MQYNYNGTMIELKDNLCQLYDNPIIPIDPQTNLYIRVTNLCNANCKFCEYHGKKQPFNLERLDTALADLASREIIGKIQLTGGEPSIIGDQLVSIVETVRKHFPTEFIGINSNGYNIGLLESIANKVSNISISRHHYSDDMNWEIFGVDTVPDTIELRKFINSVGSAKVHLSCNLIAGYIDSYDSIKKYLDYVSSIGCMDVGFVTLMGINEYSKENQITFNSLHLESVADFLEYKRYTKQCNKCRCANYLYFSRQTGQIVDLYGRFVMDKDDTPGILSFDGENLRYGFGGPIISINYSN